MDLAIRLADELWLVFHAGNGEVDGQDGEGVDKQVEMGIDRLLDLFLGAILFTKETGALGDSLLVDAGTCRDDAGRVPLHLDAGGAYHQLARLGASQLVVTTTGIGPLLQLMVEETNQRRVVGEFLLALQHLLAGEDLEGAQAILIEVVGIDLVDTQGCIAVTAPAATEIELGKDTANAVVAREDKT